MPGRALRTTRLILRSRSWLSGFAAGGSRPIGARVTVLIRLACCWTVTTRPPAAVVSTWASEFFTIPKITPNFPGYPTAGQGF